MVTTDTIIETVSFSLYNLQFYTYATSGMEIVGLSVAQIMSREYMKINSRSGFIFR
jgi:hypothetical protein